jgi:hypothetical protein
MTVVILRGLTSSWRQVDERICSLAGRSALTTRHGAPGFGWGLKRRGA